MAADQFPATLANVEVKIRCLPPATTWRMAIVLL